MILVVGAGIAGLSAALALAPFGEVLVAERRPSAAANAGAGIQLTPNAVKAMAAIGAGEEVAARASRPAGLTVAAAGGGAPLTRLDFGEMEATFGAPYLTASRADLAAGLLAAVAAEAHITVRYDSAVTRLEERPAGWHVPEMALDAAFVVVADGVASPLRAALCNERARDSGFVAWRGTAPDDGGRDTRLTLGAGCHLVRYALAGRADNIVFVTKGERPPETFSRTPIATALSGAGDFTPWPIRAMPAPRFALRDGAFVGDASHAMPPFLAQGGAMAIEDAAVLRAAVATHGLATAAGTAYATARTERVRRLAAQTQRQGTIYHLAPPFALARDIAMRRLGPRGILSQVGWVYGFTPSQRLGG